MMPVKKPRVYKAVESHGIKRSNPGWFMYDGWTTHSCENWADAMAKARRRSRGKPA